MGEIGSRAYVGSAFVTFGKVAGESFRQLIEANWRRRRKA